MASRRKSFMVGCIQYSRPETESDITMINGVVSFISKVASQEQDTYLDYVLAWCSEFERAARKSYIGPGIPSQTPRVVFSQLPFVRKGKCCHIMTTCTRTLSRLFPILPIRLKMMAAIFSPRTRCPEIKVSILQGHYRCPLLFLGTGKTC
jgi:hypothetical protein